MASGEHRSLVLGDLLGDLSDAVLERSLLFRLLLRYKPDAVVDSINTATAFAYQDIFESARTLVARAQKGAAAIDRATIEQHLLRMPMPQLIRHAQVITEALRRAGTQAYVKIGTSGTGGMGFNIPYTHSEERPSATLLTKSAIAGAHTMLLFLLGRTPDAPITVEIKPTATIAWREVAHGPVRRKGKPIPLVDCERPVPVNEAFRPDAAPWRDLGRPLDGVYIDVGENGFFARGGFETRPALGQMEFITPEEGAHTAHSGRQGRAGGVGGGGRGRREDGVKLRQHIISVGLPIVLPDGKRVFRGSTVVVPPPPGPGDPLQVAPRGWVDLRPEHFAIWITRAVEMVRQADARAAGPQGSGSDIDWDAIDADEPIEPSRFATWVFTVEDKGARIKR